MRRPSPRSWWDRLTLRAKSALVAVVPMVVLGLAVPALYATQRDSSRVISQVEHTYRLQQHLSQVLQDLVDAETGARGYLLTNERRFLKPYREGLKQLPDDVAAVRRSLESDLGARERVRVLEDLIGQRLDTLEAIVGFARRTPPGSIPYDILAEGRRLMVSIRSSLDELGQVQAAALVEQRSRLERSQHLSFALSVAVVPITLAVTLAAVLVFTTRLVRRVQRIEENARRLERGEALLPERTGDDELARLAQALGRAAATIAQQDAELRELALVDPLTGLHNRRGFSEIAEHEVQLAARNGSVVALLFADVDGMKHVNDQLGHAEGDRLLREAADVLRSALRESDVPARLGGDEFCVLLSRDTAMDGEAALRRLDREVAARNARGDLPFVLSLSFGLAYTDPSGSVTIEELIHRADEAMYEHKRRKPERAIVQAPATPPVNAPVTGASLGGIAAARAFLPGRSSL